MCAKSTARNRIVGRGKRGRHARKGVGVQKKMWRVIYDQRIGNLMNGVRHGLAQVNGANFEAIAGRQPLTPSPSPKGRAGVQEPKFSFVESSWQTLFRSNSWLAYKARRVTINGWVADKTDKGKLQFLRVRDGTGVVQATLFQKAVPPEAFESGETHSARIVGACDGRGASGTARARRL